MASGSTSGLLSIVPKTLLPDTEIAYVASIIDTRASIKVRETTTGTLIPHIQVSDPNMDIVAFLGKLTGVKPFETNRSYARHRCTEHCPKQHQRINSRSGRWALTGARTTILLTAIRPYVRFQAEAVDEALKHGLVATKKDATVAKMSQIGWPLPEGW